MDIALDVISSVRCSPTTITIPRKSFSKIALNYELGHTSSYVACGFASAICFNLLAASTGFTPPLLTRMNSTLVEVSVDLSSFRPTSNIASVGMFNARASPYLSANKWNHTLNKGYHIKGVWCTRHNSCHINFDQNISLWSWRRRNGSRSWSWCRRWSGCTGWSWIRNWSRWWRHWSRSWRRWWSLNIIRISIRLSLTLEAKTSTSAQLVYHSPLFNIHLHCTR